MIAQVLSYTCPTEYSPNQYTVRGLRHEMCVIWPRPYESVKITLK
jgi:hypothetical protein